MNKILIACSAALILTGCNIGDAPKGMSNEDAKAAIARMKPDEKIRAISKSPMSQAQKDAEYAKIEQETGVKASEVLSGQPPEAQGH